MSPLVTDMAFPDKVTLVHTETTGMELLPVVFSTLIIETWMVHLLTISSMK